MEKEERPGEHGRGCRRSCNEREGGAAKGGGGVRGLHPARGRRFFFRSHDGPADRRYSRSAKEARSFKARGKGKQEESNKEGHQESCREASEESYSQAVTKRSPGIREENQQENEQESAQGQSLNERRRA